jgi:hypothetical protein
MDYNERILFPEFIYDNRRIYEKLYVFFKFVGLIFYITSLLTCYKSDFYIAMIVTMFLSIMNNARYEYAHFKRYGIIFSSLNEYEIWKKQQYPKLKVFFSIIELSIKIVYFIITFPPQFDLQNLCEIGESVFKLHILALFIIYVISGFFSIFILWMVCCNNYYYPNIVRQRESGSLQIRLFAIDNQNEECCICLDKDSIQTWSILQCGHKFHGSCVLLWLRNHQTCPVCRFHINPVL